MRGKRVFVRGMTHGWGVYEGTSKISQSVASTLSLAELSVARRIRLRVSPHCWMYKLCEFRMPAKA